MDSSALDSSSSNHDNTNIGEMANVGDGNGRSHNQYKKKVSSSSVKPILFQFVLGILFFLSQYANFVRLPSTTQHYSPFKLSNNVSHQIIQHAKNFIDIGNSDKVYENTKSKAREYIRDYLMKNNFTQDQILWNNFEWNEKKAKGREIITTTWTGINIMIWTNTTANPHQKIRIFGAHYDSELWGKSLTTGAYDNFSGTGMLLELAIAIRDYQQTYIKELIKKKESDKNENQFEETPFLFILFDHNKAGCLGSRSFSQYFNLENQRDEIAYFIDVDSIGIKGSVPFLQTFPYEHMGKTKFSPRWLADLMIRTTSPISNAATLKHVDVQKSQNSRGFTIGIGHSLSWIESLMYQIYRYHLISVRYLNDDGPFIWMDVPSLLFTDHYNFIYRISYNNSNDLPHILDPHLLSLEANILLQFALVTQHPEMNLIFHKNMTKQRQLQFTKSIVNSITQFLFPNCFDHYIIIGPYSLEFIDLFLISFSLLHLLYQTVFKDMQRMYKKLTKRASKNSTNSDDNNPKGHARKSPPHDEIILKTHRIMFAHLILLLIALCCDTAYATIMITIGSLTMLCMTITTLYIGVIVSFIGGLSCSYILTFGVIVMRMYGERAARWKELKLGLLLSIYVFHVAMLFVYSIDYVLKEKKWNKQKRE